VSTELVHLMRPKSLKEVIGQPQACQILETKLASGSLPHVIMLVGPTGVGKSTIAHILIERLGAHKDFNLTSINCADDRGIDLVRSIDDNVRVPSLNGKPRVWLLEEVVQLPKTTQQAFLNLMEELPSHAYFILCTTTTDGMQPTFKDRCFPVQLNPLSSKSIDDILLKAIKRTILPSRPDKYLSEPVFTAIATKANGSARKALQMLEVVLAVDAQDGEQGQLQAIGAAEKQETIEFLAKTLLRKAPWPEVSKAIEAIEEKDVETIRRQVLAYAGKVLAGARCPGSNAYPIIKAFEYSWKDSGKSGLQASCYGLCAAGTK
jgi:DNA polymerase III gamma/tau subunit